MYSIRLRMTELEKLESDMLLLGKLQVCARTASAISHARKVQLRDNELPIFI